MAQIALIKDQLVVEKGWITMGRFQRVFSVYQILPGPEAAELCMFFGCLSAGRYDLRLVICFESELCYDTWICC
jgi:chromate transport protein ChrA